MQMPGRVFSSASYRYGFNGKENDNDVKGTGNQIDFGNRAYDPRIGRFLSVDNLFKQSPELTPYRFGANNPLRYVDRDGDYETDGHYWTVYMIGLMIGLDKTKAEHLATLAERPDNYVHKGHKAMTQRYTWSNGDMQRSTHSLIGSSGNIYQNIFFAVHQLINSTSDDDLSTSLHYFGDAFAHQRMNGDGYYGDRGSKRTKLGQIFELFKRGASSEHSEHIDGNGKVGSRPDMIYNRPSLYLRYVNKLAETLRYKYNTKGTLDYAVINRMVNYAAENKVSLIGIINYEVAKIKGEGSFFVAKDLGLAPDNYETYLSNTKKFLESQGVKYTTEIIYGEKEVPAGRGETRTVKIEQGTKFNIQNK